MRSVGPFLLLTLSVLFSGLHLHGQEGSVEPSAKDSIERYLERFPEGTQFAVAMVEGDSSRFYGAKRTGDAVRSIPNADSVFEIGSLSKVFTANLLAHFVSEGKVRLDSLIWEDLALEPARDVPITYEHLATHTSGLPRLPSHPSFMNFKNPYKEYGREELERYLKKGMRLNNPPGDSFQYSNLGYGLLEYTLSELADSSYEELLQDRVAGPLGMKSTTVKRQQVIDRAVQGLGRKGEPVPYWDFKAMKGAGAILSTVRDLSTFIRANFDTTDAAYSIQQELRHVGSGQKTMALGWHVMERDDGPVRYWHNGGTGGFRSCSVLDPKAQKGVVVLSNISAAHKRSGAIDRLSFILMEAF